LLDCFDFSKPPRTFVPIAAPDSATYFLQRAPSGRAPDDD